MNWRKLHRPAVLACTLGLVAAGGQAGSTAGGFVKLSKTGDDVLTLCTPDDDDRGAPRCRVASLPGEPGYLLVAARTAPLYYNDSRIGTLHERLWKSDKDPALHIFGARIVLTNEVWDSSGVPFRVNDLFRQTLPQQAVSVAYRDMHDASPLQKAGRTVQGLNEVGDDDDDDDESAGPERNNAWVDFRIDAGLHADGSGSPRSPWLLMKTRTPKGIELSPLGLRLLNSDVEDFFDAVDLYAASYQPKGVPPPPDDDDDDDD